MHCLVRGDERLLQQVERVVRVTHTGADHPENRPPVSAHDFSERCLSAGNTKCRKLRFGQRFPVEAHRPGLMMIVGERLDHRLVELAGLVGPEKLPHGEYVGERRLL